ncbi:hypothetical protein MKEN_01308500 [Mycena kentingensis (nom. inval.)]|nr:hypothetical protein MKEN_01308500 [Mycena kentingensis (nom. inval.)]
MSSRPDNLPPATKPIPIAGGGAGRARARSMSVSSSESGSPHSPTTPPASATSASPKINTATSPILSYFLTQSPSKTPGSFPFRKFGGPPVFEEDETDIREVPATHHVRRASTAVAERLAQPGNPSLPDAHHERGQGVMRRLSLSSAFMAPDMKPPPPRTPSPDTTSLAASPAARRPSAPPTDARGALRPRWASASSRATLTASIEQGRRPIHIRCTDTRTPTVVHHPSLALVHPRQDTLQPPLGRATLPTRVVRKPPHTSILCTILCILSYRNPPGGLRARGLWRLNPKTAQKS